MKSSDKTGRAYSRTDQKRIGQNFSGQNGSEKNANGSSGESCGTETSKIERLGAVVVVPRSKKPGLDWKDLSIGDLEFLVIHRSGQVIAPGTLCFPGGGIEPGESPAEAAVREFREEVGLDIQIGPEIWRNITPWNVALTWFSAELIDSNAVPRTEPREVADCLWMPLDGILNDPDLLLSNIPFLEGIQNGTIRLWPKVC